MGVQRADHEIDHRRAADDFFPLGLGDAARHGDGHPAAFLCSGLFEQADPAKFGIDLVRGLFTNVTGVEDDEIGVLDAGGLGEAFGYEQIRHTMGIVDVHLAPEGFDVELARSAHARLRRSRSPWRLNSLMRLTNPVPRAVACRSRYYRV